jgi:RNA polymerase sigma-70 factor (ECF subfamily)
MALGGRSKPDRPSDRQFFEAEVMQMMDRLYGAALRLTGKPADAEDLVAEAVLRAWEALPTLRDRRAFRRWMLRIVTNVYISEWRRRRTSPVVELQDEDVQATDLEFSLYRRLHQPFLLWWGTPEHAFLNKLLREDIERAFDSLPETYRIVLVLVELDGRSYAETADCLDLPVGTVRSRLARARGRLQRALWSHAEEYGISGGCRNRAGERRS